MKKLFTLITAALLLSISFTACSDDDDVDPDYARNGGDKNAVFPTGYEKSNVDAWFSGSKDGANRALYLFNDGSFVLTGTMPSNDKTLKGILSKGTYSLNGDFNNGSITITPVTKKKAALTAKKGSVSGTLIINDGEIMIEGNPLYIRDIKEIPSPEEMDADLTDLTHSIVVSIVPVELENIKSYFGGITNFILLDLDESKLSCGFVVGEQQSTPTLENNVYKTDKCVVSEKGLFTGVLPFEQIEAIFPAIRAYVTYDGVTYYSKVHQTAPSSEGEEELVYTEDCLPYLPANYSDKKIEAWYTWEEEDTKDKCKKIEAIFLFSDKSLVVTKSKVYAAEVDKKSEKSVIETGSYNMTSGDLTNGEATVKTNDDQTIAVTISNGILTAMDTQFIKQDNSAVPLSE